MKSTKKFKIPQRFGVECLCIILCASNVPRMGKSAGRKRQLQPNEEILKKKMQAPAKHQVAKRRVNVWRFLQRANLFAVMTHSGMKRGISSSRLSSTALLAPSAPPSNPRSQCQI